MSPDRLTEYQRKRAFGTTPEPQGRVAPVPAGLSRFVVQKHAASRLHYDFRLEHDGVLLSWAVPKGPSLNPADRRLAVHVEDHPVDYFDFEGRIPKGEYGGGTVMVWDWGGARWLSPDKAAPPGRAVTAADVDAMLRRGDLKFELFGRKLRGSWALVGGRDGKDWFLIKKRDDGASEADVTEQDRSVLSGRSMDEIAAAKERVWHSNVAASGQGGTGASFIDLSRGKPARLPATVEPMLACPGTEVFDDPKWSYEIKLDGFRTLAVVRDNKVKLLSRRGLDATKRFPELTQLGRLVRSRGAVLDGEVVALDEAGLPSFQRLQERTGWSGGRGGLDPHPNIPILYYVFDILHDGERSLLDVPLVERRKVLSLLLLDGPAVRRLDSFGGEDGSLLFAAIKQQGQEGVVAKRLESRYQPGKRTRDWVKVKAIRTQACLVVGLTPPQGGRKHFGSLAVAVLADGKPVYCGQVGSGLDERTIAALDTELRGAAVDKPPVRHHELAPREVTWVKPELVIEAKYNEWTREGLLRQATFVSLRPDMSLDDCVREEVAR